MKEAESTATISTLQDHEWWKDGEMILKLRLWVNGVYTKPYYGLLDIAKSYVEWLYSHGHLNDGSHWLCIRILLWFQIHGPSLWITIRKAKWRLL